MRKVSLTTWGVVVGLIVATPSSASRLHLAPGGRAPGDPGAKVTSPAPLDHLVAQSHKGKKGPEHRGARPPRAVRAARPSRSARLATRSRGPITISIPRIGVTARIGTSLAVGPVFWQSVGRPGQGTTIAVAAHDVTPVPGFDGHGPFHDIDRLRKHDPVYLTVGRDRYVYRVTGQRQIRSTNLHIADLTRWERLLLTTCWPRGSSAYRLVVYARPAPR